MILHKKTFGADETSARTIQLRRTVHFRKSWAVGRRVTREGEGRRDPLGDCPIRVRVRVRVGVRVRVRVRGGVIL